MSELESEKAIWTPLKIIQWAIPYLTQKGIPHARFDTECLIAYALKMDRLKVYLQFDRPLDPDELTLIREYLKRRALHEPIQYILGTREFFGHPFKVAPGVLIPRPETEQLVELAIEHLQGVPEEKRLVLDLGTGSGCIALSVAKTLPCQVWAVDLSEPALGIARENGINLGVTTVEWRAGSWFSALSPQDPAQFQLILCNPPYIPLGERADLEPQVRDFEPNEALFGGESGLEAYESLALSLERRLLPGGVAFLELHADGLEKVLPLFEKTGLRGAAYPDLQGYPRVLRLER
ncbi:MAG TPA: peptide chain release factor N(5)-glutamine methyltransferase [bacterium]|jgi:release factor glutamine methyltransferase|nr:peptide chain release factor N(5)-glutamine methyltransferase [bacterium]